MSEMSEETINPMFVTTPLEDTIIKSRKGEYISQGNRINPKVKINVFISSKCGDERYRKVRKQLKSLIEETNLAVVYTYEDEEASTRTTEEHVISALRNSDVCVFLIDNADGVSEGVQQEIDIVRKHEKKALYYFCDEKEKEKTPLQKSLSGAKFAKSVTVHSFDELSQHGVNALIQEIVQIYKDYCNGYLIDREIDSDVFNRVGIDVLFRKPIIPKTVVERIDKSQKYITSLIWGDIEIESLCDSDMKTTDIDEWAAKFLPVMFGGKSICDINIDIHLEKIKEQYENDYFNIVKARWSAIQAYFQGDVKRCVERLQDALNLAENTRQPEWVINDIRIDLRNQRASLDRMNNLFRYDSPEQKALRESNEDVHYPVLDRIHESLYEIYLKDLYDLMKKDPYTISYENLSNKYGELIASSFIIPFFNGSLTHMLLYYDEIKNLLLNLCARHNDWTLKKQLLKITIFCGDERDVNYVRKAYPEVLNKLDSRDASEIMAFCDNHPIEYKRCTSQLIAFGIVGYYLDENEFEKREEEIVKRIREWLNDEKTIGAIGYSIFNNLAMVSKRISQDTLGELCCLFIEKNFHQWYDDMFKFIRTSIDLRKMSEQNVNRFIHDIVCLIDDKKVRNNFDFQGGFLSHLRNQNRAATSVFDDKVKEYFPHYYDSYYKVNVTLEPQLVYPIFIQKCIEEIRNNNERQGKNGIYYKYAFNGISIIRKLLLSGGTLCDEDTMDKLISVLSDTLLVSKESVNIKNAAISLMIFIVVRCQKDFDRNKSIIEEIINSKNEVADFENTSMDSNISIISLKIGLSLLNTAMGGDGYYDFLEAVSYIQSDKATIIACEKIIVEYLETDMHIVLPKMIGAIVMQNVLQWLQMDHMDVKLNAVKILLMLNRDSDNEMVVNQRIISIIDNESAQIKLLVLRELYETDGLQDSTIQYVLSRCSQDPCFAVRQKCNEVQSSLTSE